MKENFSLDCTIAIFGSQKTAIEILKSSKSYLMEDMKAIEAAYHKKNWILLKDETHRIKSPCYAIGAFAAANAAQKLWHHLDKYLSLKNDKLYQDLKTEIQILVLYIESIKT